MDDDRKKKVVMVYEKNHLKQPFYGMALTSLAEADYGVVIVDMSNTLAKRKPYQHIALMLPPKLYLRKWIGKYNITKVKWILPLLAREVMGQKPDIIIAGMPASLLAGWIAAYKLKARLVYYPLELYAEQAGAYSAFFRIVEKILLRFCVDAVLTQNEERGTIYTKERGCRVKPLVIHNYKPRREAPRSNKLRSLLALDEKTKIVLYEGLFRTGRWLDFLVRSAEYLPDDAVLVLMGNAAGQEAWWRDSIEVLLQQPHIGPKVRIAPWVPHDEVMSYVADADAGVIIYDDAVRNNFYCEPGKLSDYVLSGIPVVVPDFPTIGPVVRQYGIGAAFNGNKPEEIARAVISVLSIPRERWAEALDKAKAEMIWETQIPSLLKAVSG
jgi:glycosyltransferase involved in cell wall biosynthesis